MPDKTQQPVRRLGVIGDLHAEHERLERVVDWLAGQSVDAIVCTGDIADGRGSLGACCRTLAAADVITVAGNHDRWLLNDRVRHVPLAHLLAELTDDTIQFLHELPRTQRIDTTCGPLLLCHGVGQNDLAQVWPGRRPEEIRRSRALDALIAEGEYRFVINGHMHFRVLMHFHNLTLMNAGTLMGVRAGVTILDFEAGTTAVFSAADGKRPVHLLEIPLAAEHGARRVWRDTQEFDGTWEPVLLYA